MRVLPFKQITWRQFRAEFLSTAIFPNSSLQKSVRRGQMPPALVLRHDKTAIDRVTVCWDHGFRCQDGPVGTGPYSTAAIFFILPKIIYCRFLVHGPWLSFPPPPSLAVIASYSLCHCCMVKGPAWNTTLFSRHPPSSPNRIYCIHLHHALIE